MSKIARVLLLLPALTLAACATAPTVTPIASGTALVPVDTATLAAPATQRAVATANTEVAAFVDPAALGVMGTKSRAEASAAQFNALQFGRVGAPRTWSGESGQSGSITVGPYVRVNLIDCRDFTHTVTVAGQNYVKRGTACREPDGRWIVSASVG